MAITSLTPEQAQTRLSELTVVDVRTPGEFASGHLPGALNVPLDSLDQALDALKAAAGRGPLLVVCASGARSGQACERLSALGVEVATLSGGTQAWAKGGRDVHKPGGRREIWAMDRQVRFTAGSLVLAGVVAGAFWKPALVLSGGVAAGLVYSAVSNSCAMAAMLSKLPHNRPRTGDLDAALAALKG